LNYLSEGDLAKKRNIAVDSTNTFIDRCRQINKRVDEWKDAGINPFHRAFDSYRDGKASISGSEKLMSGSYSYLGLSHDPRIKAAICDAIDLYGASSHGSRALTGSMAIHEELEVNLASFMGTPGAVIFSNGYLTNLATISTLVQPGDTIITEMTNHNSIAAGVKMSGANVEYFLASRLSSLKRALEKAKGTSTFVVSDAVFSMEGSILPLPEVVELCKEYNAFLMIDEAHSFGVLGGTGRGIIEHFDMSPNDVDIRMGTMSKSLTSVGGFIVGNKDITMALAQGANGYLFTAAQPPSLVAAALESLKILNAEPEIVDSLKQKASYFRKRLEDANLPLWGADTVPIVPVVYNNQEMVLKMAAELLEKNVFVVPAVYPAVSHKTPRIRFSITNDHSYENLDQIANTFIELNDSLEAREHSVIQLKD